MIKLRDFRALHKLKVGPVEILPRKVKTTYSVEDRSGAVSSTELVYSYETSYFDKQEAGDVNLASMMAAQVALNYGIFFDVIEFDGLYDSSDRNFIRSMMDNTSREIVTNKLLIKNEFLIPPYDSLVPQKQSSYTQAEIKYVNSRYADLNPEYAENHPDPNKYAILSSGGKDSLLSYGMIREFGEPFPVFINESGRHWFTAINAYRYFKQIEPNTEKPWCNADRVFNWMLKQLPFIRKDYSRIRSDIYPVRLWTVAVFLFGVLPVARKKGIANIVIGDEYDTTMTGTLHGIPHYYGLYDQSKYFDNAMTRYYLKKQWNFRQFSLLRSLSELLIMKVLLQRYPELQHHQVSCHAAHEREGRMYPCGKCEKCRRIIGMIRSLDADPSNCGYSAEQVEFGLQSLSENKVKQLGSDAGHLYHLLLSKGLVERNSYTESAAASHPEIMKLRFDNERSNLEDLPVYVRRPLMDILKRYADGAVRRSGRHWDDFRLDDNFLQSTKYKYHEN